MNDVFQKIPSIPERITTRNIGDEVVVMDLETLHTFSLNETAKSLWSLVDGVRTVDGIVETLLADYDVPPDECSENVAELVNALAAEHLLVFTGPHD